VLYLHHKGIVALRHFEPYSQLRCLHLEHNAITSLDGLQALTELSQLCVDGNALRDLRGVEHLKNLRHLNANDNTIESLEHARGHPTLETLCVRGNRLRDLKKALEPLGACATLRSLDLSRNDINIDASIVDDARHSLLEALSHVSNIELLYFADGNPAARSIEAYRAVVVRALPCLRWLDDAPVDDTTRRLATARLIDGEHGEIQARRDIAAECRRRDDDEHAAFPAACAFVARARRPRAVDDADAIDVPDAHHA